MDHNKIKLATEFLELCQKVTQKTNLDKSEVYSLLENYKLKDSDKLSNTNIHPLYYYENWKKALGSKKNLYIHSWRNYWSGFENYNFLNESKFIKIYLSLDRDHLFEGVKQLFTYLDSENIVHTSKSTSIVRSDNVVIRLRENDYEGLIKISKYIENNKYIQAGANKINPFLPTVGSIGVMHDDGRTYNGELSNLIANYINTYAKTGNINFWHFVNYIKSEKKDDYLFLETFNNAFFEKSKYQQIVENATKENKSNESLNQTGKSLEEILELGILLAFEKYSKHQAIVAISAALKGDYNYFSRSTYDNQGNEISIRRYLSDNLSSEQLKSYILKNNAVQQNDSIDDLIRNYVDNVIYRHKGILFENALYATAVKHNDTKEWIMHRIASFGVSGNPKLFSNYNQTVAPNYNFRESVVNNISPKTTNEIVESILYSKGIDYSTKLGGEKNECCADIILNRVKGKKY